MVVVLGECVILEAGVALGEWVWPWESGCGPGTVSVAYDSRCCH